MKSIIVTGTPGTGKTTVAKDIAKKLKYNYVDVNNVISANKLSEGYDKEKQCKIVDEKKLSAVLVRIIRGHKKAGEGVVIDSHLSHHLPADAVDVCIVTKCELKLLKARLKKRKYPAQKVEETLECEIFDVCKTEAKENGHKVLTVFTDKPIYYESLFKRLKLRKKENKKKKKKR